ncbi:hypothetical protein KL927_004020 [Ogataea polymorpha]|nr:hypothetical protein KL927_004020 [Ogataea polymorpha]
MNQPLRIIALLNVESTTLKLLEAEAKGYESVAFSFLHSYLYPKYEQLSARIEESLDFKNIVPFPGLGFIWVKINGLRSLLSGLAGGVIGYSVSSYNSETPLIGFDMGRTSTDVSRYDGKLVHVFETVAAEVQ